MVKNLAPDIRHNMHVIAQEEVEIERLDKEIAKTQEKLGSEKTAILKLKGDLATPQPVYHYAGRSYPIQQVKLDLTNRFERPGLISRSRAPVQAAPSRPEAACRGSALRRWMKCSPDSTTSSPAR